MRTTCGWDELKYLEFVRSRLPEKPVLYDVGFNRGDFTREWLARYPDSIVYGFEPIEELYSLGCEAFKDISNVKIFNFGLHNTSQESIIYYLQGGFDGMSSIHYRPKYYPKFNYVEQTIQLKKFDDISRDFSSPDFIKIDTEGNEYFILQGMENFLVSSPPKFIQFEIGECINDAHVTFKEIIDFLYTKNYTVYNRKFQIISPENVWENTDLQNYLSVLNENF